MSKAKAVPYIHDSIMSKGELLSSSRLCYSHTGIRPNKVAQA